MVNREIEFNTAGSTFRTGAPDKCAANMAKLRRELVPRDLNNKLDEIELDDLLDSSFLYVDNGDIGHEGNKINAKQALSGHVEEQIAEHNASEDAHPYIQGLIETEVETRASADITLQTNINTEASTRATADTTLQANIDASLVEAKSYTDTRETAIRSWGQEKLVGQGQGQNIKTINNINVLGSGNINIAQPDAYIKNAEVTVDGTVLTLTKANDAQIVFNPDKVLDVTLDGTSIVTDKVAILNSTDFGKVDDVKVDGVSVVTDKIANINSSTFGKVQDVLVNDVSVLDSEGNAQVSVPTLVSQLANDKGYINTDGSQIGTTIPVDADLLNHQQPSYYSHVEVSNVGTSTSEISYITINGVEKKIAGGGGGGGDLPPYPQDTSKKYALGLKYENGAWVKYWAVTEDPTSSAVGTGVVGSMIIE